MPKRAYELNPIERRFGRLGGGRESFDVTPDDAADLPSVVRYLYVGGAGNVAVQLVDDPDDGTFRVLNGVPAGTVLEQRIRRVGSLSTTATNLVGIV